MQNFFDWLYELLKPKNTPSLSELRQQGWESLTEDRSKPDSVFQPGYEAGTLSNSANLYGKTFSDSTPAGQYANEIVSGKEISNINGNPITGVENPVGLEEISDLPDLSKIISNQVTSAGTYGTEYGTSADDLVKSLYNETGDKSWLEMLIQNQYQRENTNSARQWEKMMSDTSFTRQMSDIKNAGYNPWLALQSLGGASTPSVSAASVSNTSPSSQATSRINSQTDLLSKIIQALVSVGLLAVLKK